MSLRRPRIHPLAVLLVALGLVLGSCGGGVDDTSGDGYIGGVKKITPVEPQDRVAMPELTGVDLDGNEISTADFEGKTLVINLWGSWCPPCREEAPVLREVSENLADDNVQFIGILTKDKPAAAKAFNTKAGITYPSIVDEDGRLQLAFAKSLPSQAIPTTWVIDKNGKVAARIIDDQLSVNTLTDIITWTRKSTP
ncbi:MAG: TlpA family protein disulfide reductase [Actinomycetales bacterium]|nr:TlpA family protein disulfide reductase [Actinomycetales bacterium]